MISPRTQEAQYNSAMHFQPSAPFIATGNNTSQPLQPGQNVHQYQQGGPIPSNLHTTNGFNVNHNNNYTITSNVPVSGGSSFSLPSVNQAYLQDQQPGPNQQQQHQQHVLLPPPSQVQPPSHPQGQPHLQQHAASQSQQLILPVYLANGPNNAPSTQQAGSVPPPLYPGNNSSFYPLAPGSNSLNQSNDYQYNGYNIPYSNNDQTPVNQQVQDQTSFPPPPVFNSTHSVPNIPTHGSLPTISQNGSEDAPFPGVLDPQYRGNGPYVRSATYPNEEGISKPKRSASSSQSLLGMTPETARRNRCNICQKQFKRPSSLQTHLYSHTGEKPFICNWDNCGRLFSVRSNMIRHKKLHERDAKLKKENDNSDPLDSSDDKDIKTSGPVNGKKSLPFLKKEDSSVSSSTVATNSVGTGSSSSLPPLLHPTSKTSSASSGNAQPEFQLSW